MMSWREQSWHMGVSVLGEGQGGISRVARMTARALIESGAPTDVLAFLDDEPTDIAGVKSRAARGRKGVFVAGCLRAGLTHDRSLYDAVGPARAHPRLPGLFRNPYGVWIHGVEVWDHLTPDRARALRDADFVLVNSQFTLDRFQQIHWPLNNAHVCQLATEQDEAVSGVNKTSGPPTALLIGRADKDNFRKGHAEVIAAWKKVVSAVPDAKLLLVGGGDGQDLLHQTAARSGVKDSIQVLGFVPEDQMDSIWAQSHVFAQPSWKEGFGLVYVEAMRHGLPVIASVNDAGQEVNQDGITGYNVDLNCPDALSARLIALLRNPECAQRMGAAGQEHWRQNFRFSAFKERLQAVLDQLDTIGTGRV